MATKQTQANDKSNVSTVQLAVGAASLFLFIVGLKRTFRVEEAAGTGAADESESKNGEARAASGRTR